MKSVTVYTPTRRLGRPKANFLVYPAPNHLGAELIEQGCGSVCRKQALSEQEMQSPAGVRALACRKWGSSLRAVVLFLLGVLFPGGEQAGWRAECKQVFLEGVGGGAGKEGSFPSPPQGRRAFFAGAPGAPDKVRVVSVLDAGVNMWAGSWVLKSL